MTTVDQAPLLESLQISHAGEPFTRRYWLSHCEGFRVTTPGGLLGYVEGVEFDVRFDDPKLLVVRACPSAQRVDVPVGEVEDVIPREEQIRIRSPVAAPGGPVSA